MKKLKLLFVCFLAVSFFFNASNVMAYAPETVHMEWDANIESDLGGYIIYRTNTSGDYIFDGESSPHFVARINCPAYDTDCTNYSDVDLPAGQYFWVCTAYDLDGNESGPSNEVTWTIDNPPDIAPPENPTNLRLTVI